MAKSMQGIVENV